MKNVKQYEHKLSYKGTEHPEDLYVIEDKQRPDRIKIGISKNPDARLKTIQYTAGIPDKDFKIIHIAKGAGKYESLLLHIFGNNIACGEWVYKKDIVSVFLDALKTGYTIDDDLLCYLMIFEDCKEEINFNDGYRSLIFYHEDTYWSLKTKYQMIINERKGLGYPRTTPLILFLRNKKMVYMNYTYHLKVSVWPETTSSYKFVRRANFKLENIAPKQIIEVLRINKNLEKLAWRKEKIQEKIDHIFEGRLDQISKIELESYFYHIEM